MRVAPALDNGRPWTVGPPLNHVRSPRMIRRVTPKRCVPGSRGSAAGRRGRRDTKSRTRTRAGAEGVQRVSAAESTRYRFTRPARGARSRKQSMTSRRNITCDVTRSCAVARVWRSDGNALSIRIIVIVLFASRHLTRAPSDTVSGLQRIAIFAACRLRQRDGYSVIFRRRIYEIRTWGGVGG